MAKEKSSPLFWLFGIALAIVAALSVANLYLLLEQNEENGTVSDEQVKPQKPIFVPIGPMTVNLQDDRFGSRLLYVGLSLSVQDEKAKSVLEEYMPKVHSRLLVLLGKHKADDLTRPGGKEKLAEAIKSMFNSPLSEELKPISVNGVFFSEFIIQ